MDFDGFTFVLENYAGTAFGLPTSTADCGNGEKTCTMTFDITSSTGYRFSFDQAVSTTSFLTLTMEISTYLTIAAPNPNKVRSQLYNVIDF